MHAVEYCTYVGMYVVAYHQVPGDEHQHKKEPVLEESPVVNFWILQDKKGTQGKRKESVISYLYMFVCY